MTSVAQDGYTYICIIIACFVLWLQYSPHEAYAQYGNRREISVIASYGKGSPLPYMAGLQARLSLDRRGYAVGMSINTDFFDETVTSTYVAVVESLLIQKIRIDGTLGPAFVSSSVPGASTQSLGAFAKISSYAPILEGISVGVGIASSLSTVQSYIGVSVQLSIHGDL